MCTKTANPETEARRCRRRAERTRLVLSGHSETTHTLKSLGEGLTVDGRTVFNPPRLICERPPAAARTLLDPGTELSRCGVCRLQGLSEMMKAAAGGGEDRELDTEDVM